MVQATLQAYNPSFREKSQGVLANLFTKMGLAKDLRQGYRLAEGFTGNANRQKLGLMDFTGLGAGATINEGLRDTGRAQTWKDYILPAANIGLGLLELAPVVGKGISTGIRTMLPTNQIPNETKGVLNYLRTNELNQITPRSYESLMRSYKTLDQPQMKAMAIAGMPKFGWYQNSANALKSVFQGDDAIRFSKLLSATSPQTSVQSNLENTVNIWANWTKAGRPTDKNSILKIMGESVQGEKGEDSILDAWKNNAITALSTPNANDIVLSGAKVENFGKAVTGDLDAVTLDAWMANASGVNQQLYAKGGKVSPGLTGGYLGQTAGIREIAEQLTRETGVKFEPSNIQENIWSWTKAAYELRKKGGLSGQTVQELLSSGRITDELIADVPDFSILLTDPKYADPLRGAGYGTQIDELINNASPRAIPNVSGFLNQGDLAKSAKVLEDLFQQRLYHERTTPFRVGVRGLGGSESAGYTLNAGGVRGSGRLEGDLYSPTGEFDDAVSATFQGKIGTPNWIKLNDNDIQRDEFVNFSNANQATTKYPGMVDINKADDYKGSQLFMSEDGTVGFAIKPDGEISSLVKNKNSTIKSPAYSTLQVATQNGGAWLNAIDTILPRMYSRAGFRPVARVKWDDRYAPEGWDYNDPTLKKFNNGRPDIVFMVYDPKFKGTVANGVGGTIVSSYDKAVAMTKKESEKLRKLALPKPKNKAEKAAAGVLDLLSSGQSNKVTDKMLEKADPKYLFDNYDLPMNAKELQNRAKKMGLLDDAFHGTTYKSGDNIKTPENTFWSTDNPDVANTYGTIMYPLKLNPKDPKYTADAEGQYFSDLPKDIIPEFTMSADEDSKLVTDQVVEYVKGEDDSFMDFLGIGRGGQYPDLKNVKFTNVVDRGSYFPSNKNPNMNKPSTVTASIMNRNPLVRSRFARFDPRLKNLKNLSAGVLPIGILPFLSTNEER
tara:strand:+ start:968 stop:3817 length:2850 start_codon:yes stop_codon:yes gene_type:complete